MYLFLPFLSFPRHQYKVKKKVVLKKEKMSNEKVLISLNSDTFKICVAIINKVQ